MPLIHSPTSSSSVDDVNKHTNGSEMPSRNCKFMNKFTPRTVSGFVKQVDFAIEIPLMWVKPTWPEAVQNVRKKDRSMPIKLLFCRLIFYRMPEMFLPGDYRRDVKNSRYWIFYKTLNFINIFYDACGECRENQKLVSRPA